MSITTIRQCVRASCVGVIQKKKNNFLFNHHKYKNDEFDKDHCGKSAVSAQVPNTPGGCGVKQRMSSWKIL